MTDTEEEQQLQQQQQQCPSCQSKEQELSTLQEVNQQLSDKVTQVIESTVPKAYHADKVKENEARIRSLESELRLRDERLRKLGDEAAKEKESLVLKFATAEHKIIDAQKAARNAEFYAKEAQKERDSAVSRYKLAAGEKDRLQSQLEQKSTQLTAVEKELASVKDSLNSAEVKAKWAQNKLKEEQELHKEATKKLDSQQRQDSQEQRLAKELDSMRRQSAETAAELRQLREKLRLVEAERICQEEAANRSRDSLTKVSDECSKLKLRLRHLADADDQLLNARKENERIKEALNEAQAVAKEMQSELEQVRSKESELLEFTQKMSDKSAALQAEKLSLLNQHSESAAQIESLQRELQSAKESSSSMQQQLQSLSGSQADELQTLAASLEQRSCTIEDLTVQLEDERNEVKTLKRKHAAMVKDLMRQLAAAKRKLDCQQQQMQDKAGPAAATPGVTGTSSSGGSINLSRSHQAAQLSVATTAAAAAAAGTPDAQSLCSRTSSCSSLEAASSSAAAAAAAGPQFSNSLSPNGPAIADRVDGDTQLQSPTDQQQQQQQHHQHQHQEEDFDIKVVEPDRQALIEKIVRLQRDRSRRAEKIDFLNEHVRQLTEELQKKSRLLQHYILREDSGSIAPEAMDLNKASISRKGGIMASLHTTQIADKNLTLEFSLEINRKMQSVLEDALLKNITLKDNISTLGDEIARLSKDNHKMRTKLGDNCD